MTIDHAALAERYFRLVNERQARQIAGLFADNGVLRMPDGTAHRGAQSIRNFYQSLFDAGAPAPRLINTIGAGHRMATEMLVQMADGSCQPAADFFELNNDGLILEIRIYVAAAQSGAAVVMAK
jgi:hypothetical protein